jgi:serine protease AprX
MRMKPLEMYDVSVIESKGKKTFFKSAWPAWFFLVLAWQSPAMPSAPDPPRTEKYWIFFNTGPASEKTQSCIRRLETMHIHPVTVSNWLRAVSARLSEQNRRDVMALPFVDRVQRVVGAPLEKRIRHPLEKTVHAGNEKGHRLSYGSSLAQNSLIRVTDVHDLGITGKGVRVGMLDTGFDYKNQSAFGHLSVLGEYDFIFGDDVTSNQPGDPSSEDDHGTETLSVIGGFSEGALIGTAFEASFAIAKTEWKPTETRVEEDHWVAGLEWLVDSMHVQIVSSSLGYNTFDDGSGYTYQDMNGNTCVTTVAADMAVRKGVTVIVAAGNERNSNWHYILSPADGDSVIAAGAVTSGGNLADFSSSGPTSDGRIKPDVAAMGVGVAMVDPSHVGESSYLFANGTSFSCPQVAGVCALLKQARPELDPIQIREAVRSTASRSQNPDNAYGWGVVNALEALFFHGPVFMRFRTVIDPLAQGELLEMDVLTRGNERLDSVAVHIRAGSGGFSRHEMICMGSGGTGTYQALIPSLLQKDARFYVSAADSTGTRFVSPIGAPARLYAFEGRADSNVVVLGGGIPDSFTLNQNYPNPFNASTTIPFQLQQKTGIVLKIVDLNGRSVRTLFRGSADPGRLKVIWDGRDDEGRRVATGIYLCVIENGVSVAVRKMTCLR